MPRAPAATPVLSTPTTASPALARCHAVERPWTPAPTTRCLTEVGRVGGTREVGSLARVLPITQRHCRASFEPITGRGTRQPLSPMPGPTTIVSGYDLRG